MYGDEESHIVYSSYIPRVGSMLLRNFLWRLKREYVTDQFHPLIGLYALGLVGALASVLQLALDLARGTNDRDETLRIPSVTLLVSALVTLLAMVFDREENRHLDSLNPDGSLPEDRDRRR
jgi:hypothetical protein